MLSYRKIFQQAYRITKSQKFLWIFGLFLTVTDSFFSFDNSTRTYWPVFLITIVSLFLYLRAKAGLIIAIKAILDKQETNFTKAFKVSRLFFYQLFGTFIITGLSFIVLAGLIGGPIIFMFLNHYIYRGWFLASLGILIFIPLAILLGLINVLAPLFVVIYDLKIKEALNRAFELASKFWPQLIGFGFILLLLNLPALFFSGIMVGWRGGWAVTMLISVILLAWQSAVVVFTQTVWVLVFLDLVKGQKTEELEPGVLPEV